jgi:hypothetical protein
VKALKKGVKWFSLTLSFLIYKERKKEKERKHICKRKFHVGIRTRQSSSNVTKSKSAFVMAQSNIMA